jgi:hypothetical protein
MESTKSKFATRPFVALVAGFSLIGLAVTGVANHMYGFESLTTTRHVWMAAHNILALLFCVFSVWHLLLNRRLFWDHLTRNAALLTRISREAILAAGLVALALVVFVGHAFHLGH